MSKTAAPTKAYSNLVPKRDFFIWKSLWKTVGYKSKQAEFVLYLLCISGLLLWEGFDVSWPLVRSGLVVHFVLSIIIFPLFILPFWLSHRKLLNKSGKPVLRVTGQVIEIMLALFFISGFYLVFFGNRGGLDGALTYWAHLLPSVPMILAVIYHAKRWSMLRLFKWVAMLSLAICAITLPAFASSPLDRTDFSSNESGALLLSPDGTTLYSANYDAGSISKINRETGARLIEINLGGDIRRLTADFESGILAATDYSGDRVLFINLNTNKIFAKTDVPSRPFGIIFDRKNELFWVTIFEGHKLIALNRDGEIVVEKEVAETPRGLALLSDGRLLVSHAMIGEVSIFDINTLPLQDPVTIKLHETQEDKETVSQGVPRLLDDIAVSPDEKEAWLPHVLWNFDHPFQFQSTVFPSVSVLSLDLGAERELPNRRKHLFRQINIVQSNNRTRIVSNPHDASFSDDGKKVYVTLAGSEDLMVFDLSRRKPLVRKVLDHNKVGDHKQTGKKKKLSTRRQGKKDQGGAKVVQIFRHIPGDNPRGLVVDADDIYVQNAMSLNLVKLSRGGRSAFSRVKLANDNFATLVTKDPLLGDLRRGKTLFNSANSDDFPKTPMAGDFWMSCQSCHLDGFNFTNGYLYRASPIDKYQDAVVGHRGLNNMIAGDHAEDFVGDYLRIIRQTQGGMGADERDGALDVQPKAPDLETIALMKQLRAYVGAKENLPIQASWLRLDDSRKTVHESEWINSAACAQCHSDMFEQWANSLHRLMGDSNPYYKVAEDIAAQTEGEEFRKWCMSCHHPQGILSGLTATTNKGHMFEKNGVSLFEALERNEPDLDEGTGCLFCHRITKLEAAQGKNSGGNASFTVNLKDRERYVFENNDNPVLKWVGDHQINAKPQQHAQSYRQPFYKDSQLCSSCHNEFAPGSGSQIVNTYGEWEKSPFNRPDDLTKHRSCIDCHMHGDISKIGEDVPGISTDGGQVKDNVVTHQFTGANHHLVGLRDEKLAKMSIELLKTAANLSARLNKAGQLVIRVDNTGTGHALPTGVADFRQLWLDVTLRDAKGNVVLESGKMSQEGVVDANARFFRKVFGDKNGKPVGFVFWRYEKMLEDTKIPAGGHRDEVYDLPLDAQSEIQYPLTLDAKLMFRIYPQAVTDIVRKSYPELPNPEAVLMNKIRLTLKRP